MINVKVMHLKDIIGYLIKFSMVVVIIVLFVKFFSANKEEINQVANTESKNTLQQKYKINIKDFINIEKMTSFLDWNIPIMAQVSKKEETGEHDGEDKIDPIKIPLELGLKMIASTVKKEVAVQEPTDNMADKAEPKEEIQQAQTGLSTQVVENNVPNKYTNAYQGVQVKNGTEYNLTEEMLKPDVTVNNENILIFHSHTCESYTASEAYNYTQTGTYRTTDLNFRVARVGTELTKQLDSYGYHVIHDTTYHDYPAYNGAYDRSLTTVQNLLNTNPNTDVVFDIHRDAIGDYSYAPTVKIGEEYAAQLMFVIGSAGGGLSHPNWNQNLKFAIKIQQKANELYPRTV